MEEYSFCQTGTSGQLFPDGTMALGTPGPYTWRGTIYVQAIDGPFLFRDKTYYEGPHTEISSPVNKYSYLGMSVTGGYFFAPDQMAYVAGAPRSNGHGEVLFFAKKTHLHSYDGFRVMQVMKKLDGEQFASNFGYEMATADVNGDSLPDLLVAAPQYFEASLVGGAVYVYLNDNNNINNVHSSKLTGQPESRFGQAIANLGDLNSDQCDDIAIGAPYEGDGVVYIFMGTKDGLSEKPAQTIRAKDLGLLTAPIRTFGSSLSGGIDLDDNAYPDLLVGAYDSATVVGLLARPITNIHTSVNSTELSHIDPTRPGCRSDHGTNATCFSFEACCSIEPFEHSGGAQSLELTYTIEAETFDHRKKFSRVYFELDGNNKKRSNVVRRSVRVAMNAHMHCKEEVVYLKESTRDIQTPIEVI